MSVMFGDTNAASVRLLNRAGFDVVTPTAQGCCGALYAHGGNLAAARAAARRNIEVFESLALDAIVINAAGCGSTLKEYGPLLHDDPMWQTRGSAFSAKVTKALGMRWFSRQWVAKVSYCQCSNVPTMLGECSKRIEPLMRVGCCHTHAFVFKDFRIHSNRRCHGRNSNR